MKRATYRLAVRIGHIMPFAKGGKRPDSTNSLRVLMYHKVTADAPNTVFVAPESFAAQQAYLRDNYTVISLDELEAHIESGRELPKRAVLITFDDGYLNNLEIAMPVLADYGHRAVLFVPTDYVGSDKPLPHDERLPARNPTLSWEQLRSAAEGDVFEVGSHAASHRPLTSIPLDAAEQEIRESKRLLEEKLECTIRAFSFPKGSIGDFSPALQDIVREEYKYSFTTLPGINRAGFDPQEIRRHNVEDYGLDYFEALLCGDAEILAVKDTRVGYSVKHSLNRARGRK